MRVSAQGQDFTQIMDPSPPETADFHPHPLELTI